MLHHDANHNLLPAHPRYYPNVLEDTAVKCALTPGPFIILYFSLSLPFVFFSPSLYYSLDRKKCMNFTALDPQTKTSFIKKRHWLFLFWQGRHRYLLRPWQRHGQGQYFLEILEIVFGVFFRVPNACPVPGRGGSRGSRLRPWLPQARHSVPLQEILHPRRR